MEQKFDVYYTLSFIADRDNYNDSEIFKVPNHYEDPSSAYVDAEYWMSFGFFSFVKCYKTIADIGTGEEIRQFLVFIGECHDADTSLIKIKHGYKRCVWKSFDDRIGLDFRRIHNLLPEDFLIPYLKDDIEASEKSKEEEAGNGTKEDLH